MLVGNLPYDSVARTNLLLRMTNSKTNQVSGGQSAQNNTLTPTTVSDYMSFDGTKAIRFSDNNDNWRTSSPYSVELEAYCENNLDGKWIGTVGEGYGQGWGEWSIVQSGGKLLLVSSSDNNGNQFSLEFVSQLITKQWYRLGFMFYTVGSQYRVRLYTNDVQVADVACLQPYNSANGMVFGADWSYSDSSVTNPNYLARRWTGRLRNVTIGRSLFWTV